MKIGIVGCGNVGSAAGYALVLRGICTELVMVDYNPALARAQAEDILHATPFTKPVPVTAGTYENLDQAGIVIIAAGVNQKPGETRLELLKRNAEIFAGIIPPVLKAAPQAILLIATNPVDILTQISTELAVAQGHDASRVIGSGTILDTARFRALLAQHLGVSAHSIHAHVLGEHGDSEVLHWSGASVSNIPLCDFAAQTGAAITDAVRTEIDAGVRRAAYRIIEGKGATWYGIGAGIARIAEAVAGNENAVLTCSTLLPEDYGFGKVAFSLPHVINAKGCAGTLMPSLSDAEQDALMASAQVISDAVASLG